MEKKSLLELLDEVSKERGFDKFCHATDDGRFYVVKEIIKEAGKRYVRQYLEYAYNNIDSDKVFTKSGLDWSELFQSITNTEIDV